MRIAKWATIIGIPVHYYIMPQVWAWKENRVRKLAKYTNYRYAILPFEADFFEQKHKLSIDFSGILSSTSYLQSPSRMVERLKQL